ncbi:MAG TPA: TolC family protein [Methylomirabilota bacterium]|nr:TolC family protein [Methylomirabilota bacterium]
MGNDPYAANKTHKISPVYGLFLALTAGGALVLAGCGTAHSRRSADKEVYRAIEQVEVQIFGHTNSFQIDTPYSSRKPEEIPASELIEDRLQTNLRNLTIDAALDLAVARSRRFQAAKETLYLTALTLTGQRYAFSPQFFASSSGSLVRTSDGEKFVSVRNRVGMDQLLKTGGSISLGLANDILRYYTGEPRRSVISLISLNLAQPLLRGFGRNNPAVESLTQAERNVVYAVRNYSFFQDQFALEITNDYFDLLAQKDVIRNRYTNYLGRVQSTKRLEARANDRERLSDVDQARQAELTAKNNYVDAVAAYRNSLDQFKLKLGLPVGEKVTLEDRTLVELEEKGLVPAELNSEEAYRIAVQRHLPILNAIDRFEDSKRKVRVAADQLRAELKLVGGASLQSDLPTDYTRFDPNKVSAEVGLELNLPIDRVVERNNYRATLVSFEAELRNFTLILDGLKDNIQRGRRTLDQRRQNYGIQKNALDLANRRVKSAIMLLEAGRAEVRDLVEAQDAQISAQNAVTTALVDYQQARLQLLLDIGSLDTGVPRYWLEDPLPSYLAGARPVPAQPEPGDQAVLPPEESFEN